MQASRLKLRSNLGYNINDNHGNRSEAAWNEWVDQYSGAYDTYNEFIESGHSTAYGTNYSPWTEYIEVQWQRRWLEPGMFTVYMPYNADAFKKAVLVNLEGREETGIITKREIETKPEGTFLTLSGYFAEGILKWAQVVRQFKGQLTASNYKSGIAKLIAVGLTSYHSGNRDYFYEISSSLTEEGKIQPTGSSTPSYYPILFHTEMGPLRNSSIDFTLLGLPDREFDTKADLCDWIYSTLPKSVSFRTEVFTYADYTNIANQQQLMDGALEYPQSSGQHRGYVCPREALGNINLSTTPAFAAGWKFKQGTDQMDTVFSAENGNIANISLTIDETNCRAVSRAHMDSDVGWWTSQFPVSRGMMFKGDDDAYKYRAEVRRFNTGYSPGKDSAKWGGAWNFGIMYAVSDVDANTTYDINTNNAQLIRSEMETQAELNLLNHYREETVEFDAIQTDTCKYLTNYNIGDRIMIELMTTDSVYSARIVEVDEVHAKNHVEVKIRTDKPRNTGWRKGQW